MNPLNPLNYNDPAQLAYLEKLKGNIPQVANSQVNTPIMTPYGGQPFKPVAPDPTPAPAAQTPVPQPAPQVAPTPQMTPQAQTPVAPQTYTTPSGAEVSATGELVKAPLQKYGIGDISANFDDNPFQTLQAITQQITTSLGLPDVKDNITKIADEMESLANERDDEISKIQDNPWYSGPSKSQMIEKIQDKYEKKLTNRQGKLTILQNAYNTARQEAQYAVNTALTLYDKQRQFDYNMTQDALDRAEKQTEAENRLIETGLDREYKQLQIEKLKGDISGIDSGLLGEQKAVSGEVAEMYNLANTLISSPQLGAVTGIPALTKFIPGTKAQYIKNQLKQMIGFLSLENRQKLKGSGAISDYESRILQQASSSLGTNLSNEDLRKELKKIRGIMATAGGGQTEVKITSPFTGESKVGVLDRNTIETAINQGYVIEYITNEDM